MKIPFLDLRIADEEERRDLLAAAEEVFLHGRIVIGPEVERFEQAVAERCGRRYGVGVGSGSDALHLALRALGIGPGDEVITTALSWIATTNAIALTGARPIFADVRDDLNLDPESVERLVGPRTRAIVPVHYTGKLCDMRSLTELAAAHELPIVEDAAQAFAAVQRGRPAGSFGRLACFSMNPMKVLAACGEAGMVVTDDPALRDRLVALRYNGCVDREVCIEPSMNGRLDTLQAALLLRRLERLPALLERRRENAAFYDRELEGVVELPAPGGPGEHVYYTYTIQTDSRDELRAFLDARGIETKIQHETLIPDQPAYREASPGPLANARRLVKRILCIPVHEKLSGEMRASVAETIREFVRTEDRS